ncbi:MAG: SGNH/GDSL hydrolase family protein [Acidobacteria bacterium]|nr:SGNH/GDSL hydrolase family protein [Acidobacteriota bacterium]
MKNVSMHPGGRLAYSLGLFLLGIVIAGCELLDKTKSPTAPSTITPPAADAPISYTALGASDANGVGASVSCAPFLACDNGTGYVPTLARQLRGSREVTLMNLGIPAAVLSPAIETLARQHGREVTGNFVEREMPFVPRDSTLVTISGGANDVNAVGDAMLDGAAGTDITGFIDAQARAFGADYDRLVRGVRSRAPSAFIIILNVPNLAAFPYAARYPLEHRRVLQTIAVAFSREANRQAGSGIVVLDLMCDPMMYSPGSLASDGFHPNDTGYAHIATRLAAIVNGASSSAATSCGPMTAVR